MAIYINTYMPRERERRLWAEYMSAWQKKNRGLLFIISPGRRARCTTMERHNNFFDNNKKVCSIYLCRRWSGDNAAAGINLPFPCYVAFSPGPRAPACSISSLLSRLKEYSCFCDERNQAAPGAWRLRVYFSPRAWSSHNLPWLPEGVAFIKGCTSR